MLEFLMFLIVICLAEGSSHLKKVADALKTANKMYDHVHKKELEDFKEKK